MTVTAALAFLQAGKGNCESGRPRVGPFTHLTCKHWPHLLVLVSRGVLMAAVSPTPGFGSFSPAQTPVRHCHRLLGHAVVCKGCYFRLGPWAEALVATAPRRWAADVWRT